MAPRVEEVSGQASWCLAIRAFREIDCRDFCTGLYIHVCIRCISTCINTLMYICMYIYIYLHVDYYQDPFSTPPETTCKKGFGQSWEFLLMQSAFSGPL